MTVLMTNTRPRKQLGDQLDRLDEQLHKHDSILEGLSEALNEAGHKKYPPSNFRFARPPAPFISELRAPRLQPERGASEENSRPASTFLFAT